MRRNGNRAAAGLLALLLLASLLSGRAVAAEKGTLDAAAAYLYGDGSTPQVGDVGGEWTVLALARSGQRVPEGYFDAYYANLEVYTSQREGILHRRKNTEYARVALAVTAIGGDARQVAGYDLTAPLGDYAATARQGVNGPIWALLALDAGDYPMPQVEPGGDQATRGRYVAEILARQGGDGGWALSGETGDPNLTAMALQALAKYRDQPEVETGVGRGLAFLSARQQEDGGFVSDSVANAESCAQVILALCELNVTIDDSRFVKPGGNVLQALVRFARSDGGFAHSGEETASNRMAGEQAVCALAALARTETGSSSFYRMEDARRGRLAGPPAVTAPGVTFSDVTEGREAVEALAARGILSGRDEGIFDPDAGLTRAEFAKLLTLSLGAPLRETGRFTDVDPGSWYAGYVGAASLWGLVNGRGEGQFDPDGPVTRQEAAAAVARGAAALGMTVQGARPDCVDWDQAASWSQEALAWCCEWGMLKTEDGALRPRDSITRREAAQLLWGLIRTE